jgi:hypothetical protein
MAISLKTHKMLWARSRNRCAFPGCGRLLVEDVQGAGPSIVGVEAHIVARRPAGPRGAAVTESEDRDGLANLILLCAPHHKLVDDYPDVYTVDGLLEMKRVHEEAVARSEDEPSRLLRLDEELYAEYVDLWAARLDLDNWTVWTSGLLSHSQPSLDREHLQALQELRRWLLSRVWPGRHKRLEDSFVNFRIVLDDLVEAFVSAADDLEAEIVWTRRFYKIDEWNSKRYHRLLEAYRQHVALVENLTYELTRAGNYVCDQVRLTLDASYRRAEGVLLIERGPSMDFSVNAGRPEYRGDERTSRPYGGRREFARIGPRRDFWVRHRDL